MPKSREIQRGEGFESSTVRKPNAALEAFEELVKAAQRLMSAMTMLDWDGHFRESMDLLRQALTRAGEIRKALTERKGD